MPHNYDSAIDWVQRQVVDGPLPSAVFGVATSAGIQVIEAAGATEGRTAAADDYFALFSVTKPLVGIVSARQIERGMLSLRRPLSSAVPGFGTKRADTVRLHHLLSHTAGIADPPLDDIVPLRQTLVSAGQAFAAGTRMRYSNIAFEGVAAMLEHATGRDVYSHVDELNAFAGGAPGITFDAGVDAHTVLGGEAIGLDIPQMYPQRHPAAGAFSTASALLGVASAVLRTAVHGDAALMHPSTLAGMLQPRTLGVPELIDSDERKEYGLTWQLRATSPGLLERRAFGHAGLSGTQWWIYPEHDAAFVLLTNLADPASYGVDADELNNAFVAGLG